MASYRIVCVETEHPHRHILAVGTGDDPSSANSRWTVQQVRNALANGDRFYTVSPSTGLTADVKADDCNIGGCTVKTIRSHADAVTDNNLDNLRVCSWKS
jgi:Protein of unknown function (DUF3892)